MLPNSNTRVRKAYWSTSVFLLLTSELLQYYLYVTHLITVKDDVTVDRPNRSGGHVASLSSNWRGAGHLSPLPGVVSQSIGHALKSWKHS